MHTCIHIYLATFSSTISEGAAASATTCFRAMFKPPDHPIATTVINLKKTPKKSKYPNFCINVLKLEGG